MLTMIAILTTRRNAVSTGVATAPDAISHPYHIRLIDIPTVTKGQMAAVALLTMGATTPSSIFVIDASIQRATPPRLPS
ncbi:hypothetical protein G6F22_021348 [Rhizopus arrhizus]|nr:hypothetical protein G6F22_021348 [Rhizopus arrhizus]KAG1251526.1 hypothetical protein G6F65_018316 [Rhizopus arrhizus]